ncbi:MAG: twin-arginine translocase TatA/TatE family subunit [Hyphomicrobiaceae bacterium]
MTPGIWQILLVVVLLVLLFGRGKISELMGDVAKGIKSFKKGISEEEKDVAEAVKSIDHNEAKTVESRETEKSQAS